MPTTDSLCFFANGNAGGRRRDPVRVRALGELRDLRARKVEQEELEVEELERARQEGLDLAAALEHGRIMRYRHADGTFWLPTLPTFVIGALAN